MVFCESKKCVASAKRTKQNPQNSNSLNFLRIIAIKCLQNSDKNHTKRTFKFFLHIFSQSCIIFVIICSHSIKFFKRRDNTMQSKILSSILCSSLLASALFADNNATSNANEPNFADGGGGINSFVFKLC